METTNLNAVLRRKASAAKEVWQARAMSPAKALRLSLARSAEDLWDLALAASGIGLSEEPLDAVIDALPDDGLITLLDGPDGAIGAAYFQFPVVSGLVEVQTVGKVSKLAPDPRRVTRTDAAMVAPLIDATMERFEALLADSGDADWAHGFRFGSMMESARLLSLALRATDFHVFRVTLDLAAEREGEAMLIFPVVEHPVASISGSDTLQSQALEASLMQAPADLRAVLHRLSLPLSAISALKPGDTLPIPAEAIAQTELEVGAQTTLVKTRLGQMNGMRAVRLSMPGEGALTPAPQEHPDRPAVKELPDLPASPPPLDLPEPEPVAFDPPEESEKHEDLLGDLPDIGDLPGMDSMDDGVDGELPDLGDLGSLPMATLPVID